MKIKMKSAMHLTDLEQQAITLGPVHFAECVYYTFGQATQSHPITGIALAQYRLRVIHIALVCTPERASAFYVGLGPQAQYGNVKFTCVDRLTQSLTGIIFDGLIDVKDEKLLPETRRGILAALKFYMNPAVMS